MKEYKPDCNRELKPCRNQLDRPDNGFKNSKGQSPSLGVWKDNPHKRQTLARHAWLAN